MGSRDFFFSTFSAVIIGEEAADPVRPAGNVRTLSVQRPYRPGGDWKGVSRKVSDDFVGETN
jgi:hypothetical protein